MCVCVWGCVGGGGGGGESGGRGGVRGAHARPPTRPRTGGEAPARPMSNHRNETLPVLRCEYDNDCDDFSSSSNRWSVLCMTNTAGGMTGGQFHAAALGSEHPFKFASSKDWSV